MIDCSTIQLSLLEKS